MFGKHLRRSSDQQGANLIEMALVLFLLVLLLVGVADFGRAFHHYIIITNAAREGARYASHFPNDFGGIRAATRQEAANSGVVLNDVDIDIDFPGVGGGSAGGDPVRVSVTFDFPTIIGDIVGFDNLILDNSAVMVIFGFDV